MGARDLTVDLPDGRRLDVRLSGPADGLPLVLHHGTPGSKVPVRALERAAHAQGLRLVTASRPGYGGSDRHRGRTVVDAVADTAAVLEALGASSSFVAGWSGGGPHALACAARLPGVRAALLIAGVGPFGEPDLDFLAGMGQDNHDEFGAALAGEDALRAYLDAERPGLLTADRDGVIASMATLLPAVDRAALTDEFGEDVATGFHEALRVGVDGWLDDDLAFVRPWGFDLTEVRVPTAVWQGGEDLMVPIAHGRWLADRLPTASVHLEQEQGHLSVLLGGAERMLAELVVA